MKIGIVTWYKNGNFGGTLQAFALNYTLKSMGFDVEFINYDNSKLSKKILKKIKREFLLFLYPIEYFSIKKILGFVSNNLKESLPLHNYAELIKYSQNYDYVICGSDQIWSTVNGFDKFYFLDFIDAKKRISYAPSIGYNSIPDKYIDDFKNAISSIKALSVREKKGQEIIKQICNIDATVVLDPTLLLDKNEWLKAITYPKKKLNGKYILCYFLKYDANYYDFAARLKKETGFDIICISTKRLKMFDFKNKKICGIEDFIYYLSNAEYVLTDSFHGLAFSINFNKKFAIFKRFKDDDIKSQNSRVYNLLSLTSFSDYIINPQDNVKGLLNKNFDYSVANEKISEERKKSIEFLKNSLIK